MNITAAVIDKAAARSQQGVAQSANPAGQPVADPRASAAWWNHRRW
ncbi:MAG: hypothetical protein V4739_12415 [Pseudomonadota bacterium]